MSSLSDVYGNFPGIEPNNKSFSLISTLSSSPEYIGDNVTIKEEPNNPLNIEPNSNCNDCRKEAGLDTFIKTKIYTCKYHYANYVTPKLIKNAHGDYEPNPYCNGCRHEANVKSSIDTDIYSCRLHQNNNSCTIM